MAHVGTLRDFRFDNQADDIRGAALYGRDNEKLGKIDDVIFDHATGQLQYVVVDTGGWLSSKQFLVAPERIRARSNKEDEYVTDLSKKQIEALPAYDDTHLQDERRWEKYEGDYRKASGFEETGGVLHQAGGTNILVPDSIPAEGPAPTTRTGEPVSGYKSPIHHRQSGLMDTTAIGVGQNADDDRLTFVPDAIGAGRGDIQDMTTTEEAAQKANLSGSSSGSAADVVTNARPRDIVHRGDDRIDHPGSELVQATIEGDALFNAEDVEGRSHQRGNVHDADVPSYATLGGKETQTAQGRLPNYPDAGQGQRWARFEENLRQQRPKIVGRCSVCEEFQNRRKEDAA